MSLIHRAVAKQRDKPKSSKVDAPDTKVVEIRVALPLPDYPSSLGSPSPSAEHDGSTIAIDLDKLKLNGFAVPGGDLWAMLNQFRVIKRPLISNAFGHGVAKVTNGHRIQVTSALPGEGKSYCALNLALSLAAERDCSVLLVDADMAKPSLPEKLGCAAPDGLMDALIDPSFDIRTLVHRTSIAKLSILFSGRPNRNATEFLASLAMSDLLDRLSAAYPDHLIVFDSPPLLPTIESRELAVHMGQILLVVEAGRTPHGAVKAALTTVEKSPVVGLVLNKWNSSRWSSDGGDAQYGYGYGYGYNARR